jgi:hypothetical protein
MDISSLPHRHDYLFLVDVIVWVEFIRDRAVQLPLIHFLSRSKAVALLSPLLGDCPVPAEISHNLDLSLKFVATCSSPEHKTGFQGRNRVGWLSFFSDT